MTIRFVVALMVLLGVGCQRGGATDPAPPVEDSASSSGTKAEAAAKPPTARLPERVEEGDEKTPCDEMFQLLRKCNKGSRAFRDPRFRNTFVAGCEEERVRPTEYAKMFAKCAGAKTCEELKECSEGMRLQATELGPEHVDYLLKNAEREAAMKFCDDHRQLLSRNERLERRCKPLLGILDEERSEHQHNEGCNH